MHQHDTTVLLIDCPYCGEQVDLNVEADLVGELVWDCEVCCRPWALRVWYDDDGGVRAVAQRGSD